MTYYLKCLVAIVALLGLTIHSQAQICKPNMTPEQAYLAIKYPNQAAITTQPAQATDPLASLQKLINLNTATEAELAQLDGIGAKKAQAIILYREMIARFDSVDDLDKVKGIGKATIDKNRYRLTVR